MTYTIIFILSQSISRVLIKGEADIELESCKKISDKQQIALCNIPKFYDEFNHHNNFFIICCNSVSLIVENYSFMYYANFFNKPS